MCREVNERYMREMTRISFRLLELFALGLGLPPRALDSMFQPAHTSFLRLNYYVRDATSLPIKSKMAGHLQYCQQYKMLVQHEFVVAC